MIDPIRNFINIVVADGYDNTDTAIELSSGGAALLPDPAVDGEFNLTWFNSSDYPNPADDPNVEIVRVTAADTGTDILTVVRAQEGTSASNKNAGGKIYKVILTPTKKTMEDLYNLTQRQTIELGSYEPMDGTTTPIPIAIQSDGKFFRSDANGGTALQKFHGFVKSLLAGAIASYTYKQTGDSGTESLTIPAGEDVFLIVSVAEYSSGSLPSGYTFNGQAMTAGTQQGSDTATGRIWYLALGTLASPLTANLVRTGGSIQNQVAVVYDKVDQVSPIQNANSGTNGSAVSVTATGYSRFVVFAGGGNTPSISVAGYTSRDSDGSSGVKQVGDFTNVGNASITWSGGSALWLIGISLKTSSSVVVPTADVTYAGIVDGFSGLTPGDIYYVSDTVGTISTTPGTNSIRVGKALTATKLLITH